MNKISFKVNKDTLVGNLFYPSKIQKTNPAVLFIHGWQSNQTGYFPRAEAVAKERVLCLTFDLRGHGQSDENLKTFSRKDHLNDVLAAYDFLISQSQVDQNKIGVVGASYGGYLASILTSRRKIKWLVLRAPALYPNTDFDLPTALLIEQKGEDIFKQKFLEQNNFVLESLRRYTNNALLIKCENDEIIPSQIILNYKKALQNNKNFNYELLKNADHSLSKEEDKLAFLNLLRKYFRRWLNAINSLQ